MIMMASLSMIVMAMLLLNQVPCAHFGDMFAVRNLSQCDNGDGDAVDGDDGDGDDDGDDGDDDGDPGRPIGKGRVVGLTSKMSRKAKDLFRRCRQPGYKLRQ